MTPTELALGILSGVIVAVVAALFGWSLSQATIGRRVTNALADIKVALESANNSALRAMDQVATVRNEMLLERSDVTKRQEIMAQMLQDRMDGTNGMVKEFMSVARDLIELVKIQNAVIVETTKTLPH